MSLINQMLKDLDQRGAGSADIKKTAATQLSPITPKNNGLTNIKMIGIIGLIIACSYIWLLGFGLPGFGLPGFGLPGSGLLGIQNPLKIANSTGNASSKPSTPPARITAITPAVTEKSVDNPAPVELTAVEESKPVVKSTPEIEPIAKVESPHQFETNLKFDPPTAQRSSTSTQKEKENTSVLPETAPVRVTDKKKPAKIEPTANIASKSISDSAPVAKQIRPEQKSENHYQQALFYLQQGRVAEAQTNLAQALESNPANQEARLTLASLLLDNKRLNEAKETLATGLIITPEQNDFRIALARLQVDAGEHTGALSTLEQGLPYASSNADYQGFLATMLQRADRHEDAVGHYMTALSLNASKPGNIATSSLVGLGISLQAVGKFEDAKAAFSRAQQTAILNPELSLFVEQRLKQINQRLHN